MEEICRIKDVLLEIYAFEQQLSQQADITLNEALVLCCLKDGKPRSASELATFIGLTTSRVSRIIAAFESKGMIARSMGLDDKRQMFFHLTAAGKTIVSKMKGQQESIVALRKKIKEIVS